MANLPGVQLHTAVADFLQSGDGKAVTIEVVLDGGEHFVATRIEERSGLLFFGVVADSGIPYVKIVPATRVRYFNAYADSRQAEPKRVGFGH